MHTLLIFSFIILSIFKVSPPEFVRFYSVDVFTQAWEVFTPNPSTTFNRYIYRCNKDSEYREFDSYSNFLQKQTGKGVYQAVSTEAMNVLSNKEKKLKEKRMRQRDYKVLYEARKKVIEHVRRQCRLDGILPTDIAYKVEIVSVE
jgi:hypothetical protein